MGIEGGVASAGVLGRQPRATSSDNERPSSISVFVADGHPMFRAGLRAVLAEGQSVRIVGEASSQAEAITALRSFTAQVDVVLMDLQFDGGSMRKAVAAVVPPRPVGDPAANDHGDSPGHGGLDRILMVCAEISDASIAAAIRSGVAGVVTRDASTAELLRALQIVAEGGAVFSRMPAARLKNFLSCTARPRAITFSELTHRENEVLDLVATGLNNHQIARRLVLSEKTVRNHVSHVFAKLRVRSRTEAAARAIEAGLGH